MLLGRGVLLLVVTIWAVDGAQTASFYGESYIRVPFQDASSSTDLHLQFKSQLSYGLLFLAAGSTDYVVVELKSGLIEARLDLGSGEAVLHSQPGVRLDDLQWHTVKLKRTNGKVELIVDDISKSTTETKGQFFELNIQHGLFLGGTGNFVEEFYGTIRNYRGCIKEVVFNGYDILHAAQQLKNPLHTFEVFWECDSIFDATSDQPLSFLEDTSFVAFPAMHIRKSGTFSCDFRTRSETAVVLYNAGVPPSLDFIAVEIISGKLKVSVDKGNGAVEMTSDADVSDGKWHQIDLYITPTLLELSLDGIKKVQRFNLGGNKYINLGGHLFLGGLGFNARAIAVRKGLVSLEGHRARHGSMKGCLRNIVVNSRPYGFREVQISRAIDPGCVWEFPCSSDPCVESAMCTEVSRDEFRCTCDLDECVKPLDPSSGSSEIPPEEILLIQALRGEEGGETPVTTNNIEVAFDYDEHRIRESAIIFHVLVPPKHGTLEVNIGRRRDPSTFTLLDLLGRKVVYLHDGTDTEADDTTIEMEITGQYKDIPIQLKEKYAFLLPIVVKPRNDPPRLKLPSDDTLKIAKNSKLTVTKKMLDVDDPDTSSENLVYSVMYQDVDNGFFERSSNPGQSINMFTQKEINMGDILFVHQGDLTSYLRIKVNDGTTDSDYSDLKISARILQLQVIKNTGIVLAHGTSQLILKDNLTTDANVPVQDLELKYTLIKAPKYGDVQRLQHPDNEWVTTKTFAQKHIDKIRLRYIHKDISDLPPSDEFSFIVSADQAITNENTFQITFVRVQVEVDMGSHLVLEHVSEKVITPEDLKIITNAPTLKAEDISVTISKAPAYGLILRKMDPSPGSPEEKLGQDDVFTQKEILTGMIIYKLKKMTYDPVEDHLDVTVSARGAQEAKFRLKVEYIPEDTDTRFINNGLRDVPEGGQAVIGKDDLYAETSGFEEFQYVVIEPLKHGVLQIIDSRSATVRKSNVTEFTNKDIRTGELVYKHDDSENDRDSFTFITSPIVQVAPTMLPEETEITELTGLFDITVTMRNDNPPKRSVNKVFQVVTNKARVITIDDLAYTDPDIEYDPSKLLYKRQKIPNGEIVDVRNGTVIQQFTQKDLLDGVILFEHRGKAYARTPIWVTDGQYYSTDLFEIRASEPFLSIENNTGIVVQQNRKAPISSFNLSLETNVNMPADEIFFELSEEPNHGQILVEGHVVSRFSWQDVKDGSVVYKHDDSSSLEDKFSFSVDVGEADLQGVVAVSITKASQQRPPKILHNNVLEVEEGTSGTIEQHMLHVSHPDVKAADIEYTVVSPPSHGRLKIIASSAGDSIPLTFTQEDIAARRVRYYQTEAGKTSDKFLFDVTNGFQSLQRIEFFVDIIPKELPLQVKNFTLPEGGTFTISPEFLYIKGKHFKNIPIVFKVSKHPENGFLQLRSDSRAFLVEFSSEQVKNEEIIYLHDGNETSHDEFTIVAVSKGSGSSREKESRPVTIHVSIEPVNDQPPRVTVNRGLQIWKGSMKLITNEDLTAVDPDSPPQDIVFQVTDPTNGHIAHVNNTFKKISVFTQDLINNKQIAFVHSGADTGSFSLEASDGVNKDISHSFSVVAVPLMLTMKTNNPLEVFPNTLQPITEENLFAETNDPNQTKPILYNIETKPRYGRIVSTASGRPLDVMSFSQKEINDGAIHYQHTGYLSGWGQKDSLTLEVSTLYAEHVPRERFDIDISYSNLNADNRDQLIHIRQLAVKEGNAAHITRDHLDVTRFTRQLESIGKRVRIEYILKGLPRHGVLDIGGAEARENSKFAQLDVDRHRVTYRHDDSDTDKDAFELSLAIISLNAAGHATETSYLDSFFNITVLPVNDQPFKLVTDNPGVQVIQGSSVNITADDLLTEDPDTPPNLITYSVTRLPNNGRLAFNDNPKQQIREFTQEDINLNRLTFISDGSRDDGAFYFRVSDGAFRPYLKNFSIRVVPLRVSIHTNSAVKLVQGESSVYLSSQNLDVETNGNREDVTFTVTKRPHFGKLYLGDQSVSIFNQKDLDDELVLYIQTNMTSGSDEFSFNVALGDSLLVNQLMKVIVVPLVTQNPFEAPAGSEVTITMFALDASKLAAISGDNPKYSILKKARFGKIALKSRAKRESGNPGAYREVDRFTHEDVIYGKVFYVANPIHIKEEVNDSFTYLLSAHHVQPAQGVFSVTVKPPVRRFNQLPTLIPLHPDQGKGSGNGTGSELAPDSELVSPSITTDYIIIIVFVCLIIALIVAGLVIFFLWKRRKEKKVETRKKQRPKPRPFISGPLPLNQPNVHIEPSQQQSSPASDEEHTLMLDSGYSNIPAINVTGDADNMAATSSPSSVASPPRSPDLSRTEVSAAVPSCKVTPLLENEESPSAPKTPEGSAISNNSADMFNFDWTLMDPELLQHCRTTNPVLRKNKYWV